MDTKRIFEAKNDNIVFFIPSFQSGGAEIAIIRLANELGKTHPHVNILVLDSSGPWLDHVEDYVTVVNLGTRRASRSIIALSRYLTKTKPKVLITNLPHINIVGAFVRLLTRVDTKLIAVEHNDLLGRLENEPETISRLLIKLMWISYRWIDKILAVSEGVKQSLIEVLDVSPDRISVIYDPIDLAQIERLKMVQIDHPWIQDPSIKVVLGVGRLIRQKGFDHLIEAIHIVRRQIDARLILLGEGPLRAGLLQQAHLLGLVEYVEIRGFDDNPYAWMSSSDVFVLPSRYEGFGIVVAEALASGVPVVATDCRSGPSEILEDGSLGRLVPVGDVDALADAICELLSQTELSDTFRRKARKRAQDFSVERIADRLKSILDQL